MEKLAFLLTVMGLCLFLCACTDSMPAVTQTTETMPTRRIYLEGVPLIPQFPDFPTGCEAVSAVMALQYAGEDIAVDTFVDLYLDTSMDFYYMDDILYGPDPYVYFLGDPRSENAYGCMAPVIEKALINYFETDERVRNATGTSLEDVCSQYIDNGIPVLVWVSIDMKEIIPGRTWILPSGWSYTWPRGEHCMVLTGYDDTQYIFHDPYTGEVKRYEKALAEARYEKMGKQAIIII